MANTNLVLSLYLFRTEMPNDHDVESGLKSGPILARPHLALTHPALLHQHLLANAGEYKMSECES
jgi:hypothetical protein